MHQGVLTTDRVRLMMAKSDQGCRGYGIARAAVSQVGARVHRLAPDIGAAHGDRQKGPRGGPWPHRLPHPRRLGPERHQDPKLFALTKEDVRKYVIRREIPAKSEDKKPSSKAPKIQRLITPISLQRKRHPCPSRRRQLKAKAAAADYQKLCAQRQKEQREAGRLSQRSRSARARPTTRRHASPHTRGAASTPRARQRRAPTSEERAESDTAPPG